MSIGPWKLDALERFLGGEVSVLDNTPGIERILVKYGAEDKGEMMNEKVDGEGEKGTGRINVTEVGIPKSAYPDEYEMKETTEGMGLAKEIYPKVPDADKAKITASYEETVQATIKASVALSKWVQRLMYTLQTEGHRVSPFVLGAAHQEIRSALAEIMQCCKAISAAVAQDAQEE